MSQENLSNISKSELAYGILRELDKDNKSPTELAEALETRSQSINNYLKDLIALDLVEKAEKEGRTQPYELKPKNFLFIFKHFWDEEVRDKDLGESLAEFIDKLPERDQQIRENLDAFVMAYSSAYFSKNKDSTLSKMFREHFYLSVTSLAFSADVEENKEIPDWFEEFAHAIGFLWSWKDPSHKKESEVALELMQQEDLM
jgi:predicted transcriptional regulator